MKKKLQKLTLNRETLRILESHKLGAVAGAASIAIACSEGGGCSDANTCMSEYISGCHDCPSWDETLCGTACYTATCV